MIKPRWRVILILNDPFGSSIYVIQAPSRAGGSLTSKWIDYVDTRDWSPWPKEPA